MIRLTKAIVLVSAFAAGFVELYLATPLLPFLFWFSIALAAAWLVAGSRVHFAGLPILMIAIYLAPAAYLRNGLRPDFELETIWIVPLIALMASGQRAWEWSLPKPWQWPLITWALVVSVTWPIVMLREVDFYWTMIHFDGVYNSSNGIFPMAAVKTVAYFALGTTVGILWLDALFRWSGEAAERRRWWLEARVLYPLAGAAAVASLVAIYQGFVDLQFANSGFWAYMLRAAGTLGDPNTLGIVAAFWAMGSIVLGRALPPPWSSVVSVGAVFVALMGIWMSSTRTGLAAVLVGLTVLAVEGVRYWRSQPERSITARRVLVPAAIVAVIASALALSLTQSRTHTFYGRGVFRYVPFVGDLGIAGTVNELLWERFGYGPPAILMLREHPVAGTGVGSFHTLVHDYGKVLGYDLVPDNAQMWYRHLLTELGVLGSLPWIWWCVVFAGMLFRRGGGDALTAGILRGALLGFAVASLFGMPGQSMPIIITFWTFVFWFAITKGVSVAGASAPWPRQMVALTAALLLAHVAVTAVDARGNLRPRERAERFGWPYNYGFYGLDRDPSGGPGRRWTFERALATIPVKGNVLKFVGWIDHPDADEHPVQVRVWADSKLVFSGELKRSASITLDIPATPGEKNLVLETWISRTWRPSDHGSSDRRRLGLSVREWQWE